MSGFLRSIFPTYNWAAKSIVGGYFATANYLTTTHLPADHAVRVWERENPENFYSHLLAKSAIFSLFPGTILGVCLVDYEHLYKVKIIEVKIDEEKKTD